MLSNKVFRKNVIFEVSILYIIVMEHAEERSLPL